MLTHTAMGTVIAYPWTFTELSCFGVKNSLDFSVTKTSVNKRLLLCPVVLR